MSWFRNPVLVYVAATAAVVAVVMTVTTQLSDRAAEREAEAEARRTTELLADSVVQPALPFGLVHQDPFSLRNFEDEVDGHLVKKDPVKGDVRAARVWRADGTILYASDRSLIGKCFPLDADKARLFRSSGTRVDVTTDARSARPTRPGCTDEESDPHEAGMVEVYTPVKSPEGPMLLFEAYFSASDVAARRAEILTSFQPITLAGFGCLGAVAVLLLWGLTRRLRRLAQEREDLLLAAVDASDAERRRLARDLHAGVLRDLRGTSTGLQELAGDRATAPLTSTRLLALDDGLRGTVRSLRSQLLRIYPPAVDAPRLENALADLVAPAAASGIDTDVRVTGAGAASQAHVTLVWRAAQEAVRNAVEHARCRRIEVEVTGDDRHLALRVADDGVGFVPGARSGEGTLGLRALRDLVHGAGGSLDVESGPGRGTTVRMRVGNRS